MKTITPHFDRSSGRLVVEYAAEYDGNCIGFFPNHSAAEIALDDYVLDLAQQGLLDAPLAELAADAAMSEPPTDAPGNDCPDHGPNTGDCDKCANPGRAIARHWHRTPRRFVTALRALDMAIWPLLAESYAAYLANGTTADDAMLAWHLAVQGTQLPAHA